MSNKATNIVEYIKQSGISVRRIAKDLGIPEQRIYGWTTKGAKPSYEDAIRVKEYLLSKEENTNQSQPIKPPDDYEAVISVLLSRVAELLSYRNGTSSVVELTQMQKDVEQLKKMKS